MTPRHGRPRRLNGLQTSGRTYRQLSEPEYEIDRTNAVTIPMSDGVRLHADVFRSTTAASSVKHSVDGRIGSDDRSDGADDGTVAAPALVSYSCYPRQIQDLGAPLGFLEAGASDFFVTRGYVHVIVNARSTGGSEGRWGLFDQREQRDVYEVIEWVAAQPWCDGNVGGLGISYFGIAQLAAAAQRPPHLKAIFPFASMADLYDAVWHHGVLNSGFYSSWMSAVGLMAAVPDRVWNSHALNLLRQALNSAVVREHLGGVSGDRAAALMRNVLRTRCADEPFGRLWRKSVVEHPLNDHWWQDRSVTQGLADLDIPVYLGCQWDNIPVHLPGTFTLWEHLTHNPNVRMTIAAADTMQWPWESLHVEALAWYDHWLKGRDTGIMAGPPIRYVIPGTTEWCAADTWPPADYQHVGYALRGDGTLGTDEGPPGQRSYLHLPAASELPHNANTPTLPDHLHWDTQPFSTPTDIVGEIELRLDATITALDTSWIVTLDDIAPDDATTLISAGWLRAQLRTVDDAASRTGRPVLPCREAVTVPRSEIVTYRIALVPNSRRIGSGHRLRLLIASADNGPGGPSALGFTHTPLAEPSLNTVHSTSRLLLPTRHPAPDPPNPPTTPPNSQE